jgi:DNA transformation protein
MRVPGRGLAPDIVCPQDAPAVFIYWIDAGQGPGGEMKSSMKRTRGRRANPLAVTDSFRSFVLDQLAELGDVVARSMFGGVGLYCRGVFFGIIAGDVLYLKVNDTTRRDYERAGAKPFKPYADRAGTMRYYAVPLDVLEAAPELVAWAEKAVGAAEHQETRSRRATSARIR